VKYVVRLLCRRRFPAGPCEDKGHLDLTLEHCMNVLHAFFPVTVWSMAGGSGEGAIIFLTVVSVLFHSVCRCSCPPRGEWWGPGCKPIWGASGKLCESHPCSVDSARDVYVLDRNWMMMMMMMKNVMIFVILLWKIATARWHPIETLFDWFCMLRFSFMFHYFVQYFLVVPWPNVCIMLKVGSFMWTVVTDLRCICLQFDFLKCWVARC